MCTMLVSQCGDQQTCLAVPCIALQTMCMYYIDPLAQCIDLKAASDAGINAGGKRDFKGYYKSLGIDLEKLSIAVTQTDIKQAFLKGAKLHHPDKIQHLGSKDQSAAKQTYRLLQEAYEVLKDPEKRKIYDSGSMPGQDIL